MLKNLRLQFSSALAGLAALFAVFAMTIPTWAIFCTKTILVLGDSLSAEYGIARGTGWVVSLLEKRLNKEELGFKVFNAKCQWENQ